MIISFITIENKKKLSDLMAKGYDVNKLIIITALFLSIAAILNTVVIMDLTKKTKDLEALAGSISRSQDIADSGNPLINDEYRGAVQGNEPLIELLECCVTWSNCDGMFGKKKCEDCGGQQQNGFCTVKS